MASEAAMEEVKAFNAELQSLYETRPPVSKAKMTDITKRAMKTVKLYKHVVHSVEKFIHKCKPEYKVPGLYVIDSIVRQSRHQFKAEKDVFAPRFQKNIKNTFQALIKCPEEERPKIVRVLNLWQKNGVFPLEITQMLHEVVANAPSSKPPDGRNGSREDASNVIKAASVEDPTLATKISTMASQLKEQAKENKPAFDRKLLDFDYGEEDDDPNTKQSVAAAPPPPPPPAALQQISHSIETNPTNVEDLHKIASSVLNPSMLESIQKALAAQQRMAQMTKPDPTTTADVMNLAAMVPPPNAVLHPNPFGIPVMVANPFAAPPPPPPSSISTSSAHTDVDIRQQMPTAGGVPGKDEDLRQRDDSRRRRSRSPGGRRRSRSRSGNRSSRRRDRSRDRRRDRSSSADRERERERLSKGLPPMKKGCVTLCSNTLWLGHVSKTTTESDLEASFGEYGKILSIDIIPPRGCAYICMDRRQDAYRTLLNKRNIRMKGSSSRIKIAWAPHKGTKNHKNLKDFWDVDQGCFYIPDDCMPPVTELSQLEDGGMIDMDSMSDELRQRYDMLKSGGKPLQMGVPSVVPAGIPLPFGVPPVSAAFQIPAMASPVGTAMSMMAMPTMAQMPSMMSMLPAGMMRPAVPPAPPASHQLTSPLPTNSNGSVVPPPPPPPLSGVPPVPTPTSAMSSPPSNDTQTLGRPPQSMSNTASFGPRGSIAPTRGPMGQINSGPMGGPMSGPMGGPMGAFLGGPRSSMGPMGMGGPRGPLGMPMGPMGPMGPRGMGPRGPGIRNGSDGHMDGPMDMPPRFGGHGGFMGGRGPPGQWNGPPGGAPNWRHCPPGMRPDFRPPPQHLQQSGMFNGPPPAGGPFAVGAPMAGHGGPANLGGGAGGPANLNNLIRLPQQQQQQQQQSGLPAAGGGAMLSGSQMKRTAESTSSTIGERTERKRERKSRWSDAPDDSSSLSAAAAAPTLAPGIPTMERIHEDVPSAIATSAEEEQEESSQPLGDDSKHEEPGEGTPVADEAASPKQNFHGDGSLTEIAKSADIERDVNYEDIRITQTNKSNIDMFDESPNSNATGTV